MFSKSWFELGKEKTLMKLQEQLESAGIKNEYLDNRVNKTIGKCDERLQELLSIINDLCDQLESVMRAASKFHKGATLMKESTRQPDQSNLVRLENDDILETFCSSFEETTLKLELSKTVIQPTRQKLREFADMKNRIKEVEIFRAEKEVKMEALERLRSKAEPNPAQVMAAEEEYAQKDVQYNQAFLRLIDELEVLKRDKTFIVANAFNRLAMCQYRFVMTATACLREVCGEGEGEGLSAATSPRLSAKRESSRGNLQNRQPSLNSFASADIVDATPTLVDASALAGDHTDSTINEKDIHGKEFAGSEKVKATADTSEAEAEMDSILSLTTEGKETNEKTNESTSDFSSAIEEAENTNEAHML